MDAPVVVYINDGRVDNDGAICITLRDAAPPFVAQVLVTSMRMCVRKYPNGYI